MSQIGVKSLTTKKAKEKCKGDQSKHSIEGIEIQMHSIITMIHEILL